MRDAVLTVHQMRAAERAAIADGVTEWELMRRAGEGAAQWVWRVAAGRHTTVLCGPGNNGGDGYVIAQQLLRRGAQVTIVAPAEPATRVARQARRACHGAVRCSADGVANPVLVDCLFGSGLNRPVAGAFAAAFDQLLETHPVRIAIDVPSGVEGDTGALLFDTPPFDLTLSLGAWKRAHFLQPALATMGERRLIDIGLDTNALAIDRNGTIRSIDAPARDAHKYTRGLVAIVAGRMPGAPILAARAAMRVGAGYVKLLSNHSHPDVSADLVIDDGALRQALEDERIDAVLIGPGLGRDEEARERLATVLESGRPAVIDADALHLLDHDALEGTDPSRLLVTPHEGELHVLCQTFGICAPAKLAKAQNLAMRTGLNVLAKGSDTVFTSPQQTTFFDPGSRWLSVAGSGDVLAGILAARLAVHGVVQRSVEEAVAIHHEAALLAKPAFTAADLASTVNVALRSFL